MIRLVLQLDDKGYLEVSGPVDDKPTCLGILELAKHLILTDESWLAAREHENNAGTGKDKIIRSSVKES